MNLDFVERYKIVPGSMPIRENTLIFKNKEELFAYFSHLETPKNLGAFKCSIGAEEYFLEIEPWYADCLHFWESQATINGLLPSQVRQKIEEHYSKIHLKRLLGAEPVEMQYFPDIKMQPPPPYDYNFINDGFYGISYALVKL